MIEKISLINFKRFRDVTFDLTDSVILAGPNNSGKTTLLQAISAWHLALRRWWLERGPGSGSTAKKRTGVAITRKDFTSIPLREMNLLWTNRSTALSKEELSSGQKLGTPRVVGISAEGTTRAGKKWSLGLEFIYRYPDVIHVRPTEETRDSFSSDIVDELQIVHVPPFSGTSVEETGYDRAYQDWLIGQGKPGDILRNLLLETNREKGNDWNELCQNIRDIFSCELLVPEYEGQPFILCEYREGLETGGGTRAHPKLDISCAGSGFLQVLMLLSFFYARPASVLLLDEPDAHLHVILQKQVYDRLREVSRRRKSQLLIATHSEVLIDSTSPKQIMSFLPEPRRLANLDERDQLREALKKLTSFEIVEVSRVSGVLYLESESDLSVLREWARVLNHPAYKLLCEDILVHYIRGRDAREASGHFYTVRLLRKDIMGLLILDGDNHKLADHEVRTGGLEVMRWARYEIENYLIHPESLVRFVETVIRREASLFVKAARDRCYDYLKKQLPPAVLETPLDDHDYLAVTPASKKLLPAFFRASDIDIAKKEYYQVAAQMKPDEISSEVTEKLDKIYEVFR